jgi:Uma2 family endonuclease
MTVDTRVFTADELLQLPDDGSRYELVEGELRKMSPTGADYSAIALWIGANLVGYLKQHNIRGRAYGADGGFVMSRKPDTVFSPDVGYVVPERVISSTRFFPGYPDLAIEVVSSSDSYSEVLEKKDHYLNAGTRVVVIVDPRRSMVQVYRTSGLTNVTDVLTVDDVVPGWSMTLDDIFTTVR